MRLEYLVRNPVFIYLVSSILIFTRRPDAFIFPQLFAEDGVVWLKEAYEIGGLSLLLKPQDDYLQTLSRIVAWWSLFFPFQYAPYIFNAVALCVQVLPVVVLFSKRFDRVVTDWRAKAALAFFYIGMPNTIELHMNLSYAQWRLALIFFLLIISSSPTTLCGKILDLSLAIVSSLSGPYAIFLFPVAIGYLCYRREQWCAVLASVAGIGGITQGAIALLFASGDRERGTLGASFEGFCQLFAGQLTLSSTVGVEAYRSLKNLGIITDWVACCLAAGTLFFFVVAVVRGSAELRALIVFAALIVLAALISPNSSGYNNLWQSMNAPGAAARYWFFPAIALFATTIVYLQSTHRLLAISSRACIVALCLGVLLSWRLPAWKRYPFYRVAQKFANVETGKVVEFPIHPPGYTMRLVKRY